MSFENKFTNLAYIFHAGKDIMFLLLSADDLNRPCKIIHNFHTVDHLVPHIMLKQELCLAGQYNTLY